MMRREFDLGAAGVRVESFPAAAKPRVHAPQIAARAPALSRSRQLTVYSISLGVWLTGAVWLLAHYFMEQEGAFGPSPHPLEFWSIAAHGAFALATLWMLGLLWAIHIPAGWRSLRRRWTGSLMFGVLSMGVFFTMARADSLRDFA